MSILTNRLLEMRKQIRNRAAIEFRQAEAPDVLSECISDNLTWTKRAARLIHRMCEAERPVIFPNERIAFTRTVPAVPSILSPKEWHAYTQGQTIHELGPINNICADWGMVLLQGLNGRRQVAVASKDQYTDDPESIEFLDSAIETIDAVLELAGRYAEEALRTGQLDIAENFGHSPANPPRSFYEALQALRFLHATIWLGGHYHVGLGRFDQYMWPYLKKDLECEALDNPGAEELLAEFFLSLNKDSDLFPGVQQGDNGQSLTLGGMTREGLDGCNPLTRMALRVACETAMIDPKINLRISSHTDLELLSLASELTRRGLGFPQYSNDEVVIPALAEHGYALGDARDYTVAACWEFIIPGKGMEVVNIGAVSFPYAVDQGIRKGLKTGGDFSTVQEAVKENIRFQVDSLVTRYRNLLLPPAPYYSVFMDGCLENGRDLSTGLVYNNYGIHGACSANAADALAAVKLELFDRRSVMADQLIKAFDSNFREDESLRLLLIEEGPKVGRNSDLADEMLVFLFDEFAASCESHKDNGRGGIIRPGSGSAMYHVWLARGHDGMSEPIVGATADGRRQGEFFSANLSPSPGIASDGPFSVFGSFSKIDYYRIYNGGPVTLELSDTVFADPESIRKVSMLVRTFAQLGCQQLQINSLNVERLNEARMHPELFRDLIVRVWGWSGYFCELAPEYQEQIVARALYNSV